MNKMNVYFQASIYFIEVNIKLIQEMHILKQDLNFLNQRNIYYNKVFTEYIYISKKLYVSKKLYALIEINISLVLLNKIIYFNQINFTCFQYSTLPQ